MCVKQQEIYIERKKQRHDESLQQMTRAERDRKIRETRVREEDLRQTTAAQRGLRDGPFKRAFDE